MPLSEEDRRQIKMTAEALPGDADYVAAAYALGVERARVVKAPVWVADAVSEDVYHWHPAADKHYEVFKKPASLLWIARYNTNEFARSMTKEATLDSCWKRHEDYVLSMLETPQ